MDPVQYQGLFYLSLGTGSFFCLFLGLRILSDNLSKMDQTSAPSEGDEWHSKESLEIVRIINETHDIKSFRFRRPDGKGFPKFAPGQFLSFQIGDDPKLLRSYSISSTPLNHQIMQVSIKLLKDGKGSSWFHSLHAGDKVIAHPPSGLFTDIDVENHPRVYVAGGIGITPILSMIQANLDAENQDAMTLFYGMRSTNDMAFHDLITALANRHEQLTYIPILSAQDDAWSGDVGYIDLQYIESKAKLNDQTKFYMCGPAVMTDNLIDDLANKGYPVSNIHNEKFASPQEFDRTKIPERNLEIEFEGQKLTYRGKDTILEFLEANNIHQPFACRVGVCGSCKCKVEGSVEAITDAGLTEEEKRNGMVLSCVAFPSENLKITTNS